MALPARVLLAMDGDIYLGYPDVRGSFSVALSAELAFARNRGLCNPGLDFVFIRDSVALGALQ